MENNLDKASELISEKDFAAAKDLLDLIAGEDENNVEVQKNLGLCNVNLNRMAEARKNFENVVKINPDDAVAWFYIGLTSEHFDDLETAKKASGDVIYLEGTRRQLSEKKEESEKQLEQDQKDLKQYERYTVKKANQKRKAEKARLIETEETLASKKAPPEHGGRDISDDAYIAVLEKKQNELELATSRYTDAEAELASANQKLSEMSEKLAIFERFGAKGGDKQRKYAADYTVGTVYHIHQLVERKKRCAEK